jgi:hypothetical protein
MLETILNTKCHGNTTTSYDVLQYSLNESVVLTFVMWFGIVKEEYCKPKNVSVLHYTVHQTCFENCDNSYVLSLEYFLHLKASYDMSVLCS